MLLYYIGIIKNASKPSHELCAEKNLTSYGFFTRSTYDEAMTAVSKLVAERTKPAQRQSVEEQGWTFHVYSHATAGIAGVVITDHDYDTLVAHQLLSLVVDEFLDQNEPAAWKNSKPTLQLPKHNGLDFMKEYEDPRKVNKLQDIQDELNKTRDTVAKTVEKLLERGEKIDTLVAKSEDLSFASKKFYTQAKKTNSCCVVM